MPRPDEPPLSADAQRADEPALPSPAGPRPIPKSLEDARVGPYHLLKILGEGGFGVVYLAERREPFVQQVALKVLRPGMDSAAILQRFDLERQALALMDHPGIAKVLDGGVTDETSRLGAGRPYFVMELVRGESISDYCSDHAMTITQRVKLFLAVCDAVQHAHTKGVIHRDLKPSNILVMRSEGAGGKAVPKVIDFGIAKAVASGAAGEPQMTMTGQFVGTPEYMSPEQAAGAGAADVDTRSDVYSLGVVLYKLLTGLLPFEPEQLWRAGLLETMRVIREVEPPKPSTRVASESRARTTVAATASVATVAAEAPDALSRRLRGDLDWICMRALEKSRERRYQSPGALAADLRRFLRTEPVEAGPPTTAYKLRKFVRRRKGLVAAAGTAMLAIVVGLVLALAGLMEARTQRDLAVKAKGVAELETIAADKARAQAETNFAAAERQQRHAEASLAFIQRAFGLARPIGPEEFTVEQLVQQMDREVAQMQSADPEVRAVVQQSLGELFRFLGNLPAAERNLTEVVRQLRARGQTDDLALARACIELARVHNDQNAPRSALPLVEEAVGAVRASAAPDAPMLMARALTTRATALRKLGRRDDSVSDLREAIGIFEKRGEADSPELINPLAMLAPILCDQAETRKEALALSRRCVELCNLAASRGDRNDLLTANAYITLGRVERENGHLDASAEAYAEAISLGSNVNSMPGGVMAAARNNYAVVLRDLGRREKARELAGQALAARRAVSPDSPEVAETLDLVAELAADAGDLDAAVAAYEDEIRILTQPDIGDALSASRGQTGLADVLIRLGRFDEARTAAETALETRRARLPAGHWRISSTQSVLGSAMAGQGRFAEAEPMLLDAVVRLRADKATTAARLRPMIRRVVDLYQQWKRPEEVARWQAEFDALDDHSK